MGEMNGEAAFNPEDPAFLASRALDEELSIHERQRLDNALSESVELRQEAEGLRRLDVLLRKWGAAPVELDWETHAALIEVRLSGDSSDRDLQITDELLRRWGEQTPEVDEDRFVEGVMARVAPAERLRAPRPLILRLGVPLAAAAAVSLVVFAGFRSLVPKQAVLYVSIGPVADRSTEGPEVKRVAVAVFDRTPELAAMQTESGSLSFIAMGASPEPFVEELPPL